MENNLEEISRKFFEIKSELIHGGYTGELLYNQLTDTLTDEILHDLDINKINIKKAMVNMFFLGQITEGLHHFQSKKL